MVKDIILVGLSIVTIGSLLVGLRYYIKILSIKEHLQELGLPGYLIEDILYNPLFSVSYSDIANACRALFNKSRKR